MRKILFGLGLLSLGFTSLSQQVPRSLTAANGTHIGFYEFRPYNYNANSTRKYPLIIFLQGVGGQGNGTSELYLELEAGLPKYISEGATMTFNVNGREESFIVLSPQLDRRFGSWQNFYVDEMLKYARQNLRVDNDRIYMTGLSLGGGGTWKYAGASKSNAEQFAAIAPICGTCDWNLPTLTGAINGAKTSVWAFHGVDDPVVGVNCTNIPINALRAGNSAKKEVRRTIYPSGGHGVWDKAYGPANSSEDGEDDDNDGDKDDDDDAPENLFEWFLQHSRSGSNPPPPNAPPVANAGNDIRIALPTSTVTLNGTSSYDPDGTIASFSWSKIAGPSASISNSSWGSTSVTGLTQGTYVFRLTVSDNNGSTNADEVTVVVDPSPVNNQLPVANAGSDIRIVVPASTIVLNGTSSYDPDGSISEFSWSKISGPFADVHNRTSGSTTVSGLTQGTYIFRLTVADNKGATATDDVTVTVETASSNNLSPVAIVPSNISVTLPVANVVLNGTSSFDPDGTIHGFSWTKMSGPNEFTIENNRSGYTYITGIVPGTYVFRLTVTDNKGATAFRDLTVTVSGGGPVQNLNPVAIAGNDIRITVPVTTVILNGTSSYDPDGVISGFSWAKISGPSSYYINNAASGYTTAINLSMGTYVFRLTVSDSKGGTSSDDITVFVTTAGSSVVTAPIDFADDLSVSGTASAAPGYTPDRVTIYPNPVLEGINLNWTSAYRGNAQVRILDGSGRLVRVITITKDRREFNNRLNLSTLTQGTYYLEVRTKTEKPVIQKFIKK